MRRQSPAARFGQIASGTFPGLASGMGLVYMLVLMLLALLFFLTAFRGKVPDVLDKVFATPPPTEQSLAARREVLAGLLGGAWLDPKDGTGFAETEGYQRLLAKFSRMQAVEGEIVANPPLFDRKLAMASPDVQRSEQVRVRGKVMGHWAKKLDKAVYELEDVWRVFLVDRDGDNAVVVDLVNRPPPLVEGSDTVEIDASFYRLVRYETKKDQIREIPYLLGRNLRVLVDPNAANDKFHGTAMLLLLIAIAGMLVWGVLRVVKSRPRAPTVRWRAPHIG